MFNFTVGPVQASTEICLMGSQQVPYFRTSEFSEMMLESEGLIKKFAKAPNDSKVIFITGSGTASMEATIMNTLSKDDRALVVNGGSFGKRFVELCSIHEIPYSEIKLELGETLTSEKLMPYDGKNYTTFIVNLHETSIGMLYDIKLISDFCKKNDLFLIVDSISSFLADPFDMEKLEVDVMLTGSQKALACPPGVSIIVLSSKAIKRVNDNNVRSMYFNLKDALKNAERGQTPFTPAVGILKQINLRLNQIDRDGGVEKENEKIAEQALDFRNKIKDLPFEIVSKRLSNAVTPLKPITASAYDIFLCLKDEYNIWICPNGGVYKDSIFRVGHRGNLTKEDNTTLINAFKDMEKRGII